MAKEYIERETLISRINGMGYHEQIKNNLLFIARMIPTADVVEIRSGRWIGIDSLFWKPTHSGDIPVFRKTYRCSECRRRTAIAENYCPHCGCKMDKEDCNG